MTPPDPQLIAAILKATEQFTGDPLPLADLICRAHEIKGQIAHLDRETAVHHEFCCSRRAEIAAERAAVQARCPHPVTTHHHGGPGPEESYRSCAVCGGDVE